MHYSYALRRPDHACRFDRQIMLDRPDITGREQIFQIHMKKLKLEKPITYFSERMAALTPGFSGADIANVCNEAALIAARAARDFISLTEFEAAVDRVIGGMEKKNKACSGFAGRHHLPSRRNPVPLFTLPQLLSPSHSL